MGFGVWGFGVARGWTGSWVRVAGGGLRVGGGRLRVRFAGAGGRKCGLRVDFTYEKARIF